MPGKAYWSSLRRRVAVSDHPPRSSHPSQGVDDFGRRLTLGDKSEWVKERQDPARGATLGDVGDWFRNKLPSHRPERGGTLRNNGFWEKGEANDGIPSSQFLDKVSNRVPGKQISASNRRGSRRSRTGGSDRLMDWNTPKNLGEAGPETKTASISKEIAGQNQLMTHRKWNDFGSLRIGKKHDEQNPSANIETEKEREKQPMRRYSRAESFAAVIEATPSILKVLEANRKARRKAREDRESLRESGDYLGVQGVNPQTGVLDQTSDSGESILSTETEHKLLNLEVQAKNASSAAERKEAEIEIVKIHLDHEIAKVRRVQKEEKQLAASATGKWRRGTNQWSSVQEPGLSPIAQSHRSASVFSRRPSRKDLDLSSEERLIDLSLPHDCWNSKQPATKELVPVVQPNDSSHSSDTIIKTPHRRSLANLSPAALELFENDISFHNPNEPGPDRDQIPEPSIELTPDGTQTQTALKETHHLPGNKEICETGEPLADLGDQIRTSKSFLEEGLVVETEPGGTATSRISVRKGSLLDLLMILIITASKHGANLPVKSKDKIRSQKENILPESYVHDLTTNHEQSITPPTRLEPTVSNSLENQYQPTQASTYHQQILPSQEQETLNNSKPSPTVQLLQRRTLKVGIANGPLPQNEAERSATRNPLTAPPFPTKEATFRQGLDILPTTTREIVQINEQGAREASNEFLQQLEAKPEIKAHIDNRVWTQSAKQDITNRSRGQGGHTAQAQAQSGHLQSEEIWHNAKQPGSFPGESWAEYIAETGMPAASNQAMDSGMHVPGSLPRHLNAEDGIADLSSNRCPQGETGGLWDAIKEFLHTIKRHNMSLLRLYWGAVKPVFDYSSPYWRATDREDHGWEDFASICLALPLIFGLLMMLVWSMELTAIIMKCTEEDWDCLIDEALSMFRRSLTGVYMDD
ncbi:hypothetical protein FBEOM_845 [Fusarium beomiforme]|uniref:Uncharacterized protein n=1 Tax=Fusarium beomiforme TaxID=44412 RepID=A0A9P5AUU0_9HYPO|nr:hypothetical protein FBEOM_845 [Fusarium beomiforme]